MHSNVSAIACDLCTQIPTGVNALLFTKAYCALFKMFKFTEKNFYCQVLTPRWAMNKAVLGHNATCRFFST
jgi:hypothetical protein